MTRRRIGAVAVGAFTIGILSGTAGTIVGHDATTPGGDLAAAMADHMAAFDMTAMMSGSMGSMMSSSMMSGQMMGPGSSFDPGMMSGPAASSMPGSQHERHHAAAGSDGAK
jgi:hypothetical protein